MAVWRVERRSTNSDDADAGWQHVVSYENLQTGVTFGCGSESSNVPLHEVVSWILGEADRGDLVLHPAGGLIVGQNGIA